MKRKFQLAGAILSIVLGSIITISSFFGIYLLATAYGMVGSSSISSIIFISAIIALGFSASIVVLGSLFCRNKPSKGIAITLLILTSVLALMQISNLNNFFSIVLIFAIFADIAMLITYLAVKDAPAVSEQANAAATAESNVATSNNKIELLTQLRNNGTLTEEEFKDLLKKELLK